MDQRPPHKTRDTEIYRGESREKPQDMSTGEKFLNRTAMSCGVRLRINKWDLVKLQSFCKANDTVNRTKWQPTDWKKSFTNPTSNRGLISNIYKEFVKLDSRKSNNPIKNRIQN